VQRLGETGIILLGAEEVKGEFEFGAGRCGGTPVSTAASLRQGPGFDSGLGRLSTKSLHILPVSAWVSSGCSGFLPTSERCAG